MRSLPNHATHSSSGFAESEIDMRPPKAYKTYEASIDAERNRERQHRKTRQGEFEASFVSFEANTELYFPLTEIIGASGPSAEDAETIAKRRRAYKTAYERVCRKAPHCIPVFNLIVKNGKERQKSICELADSFQGSAV